MVPASTADLEVTITAVGEGHELHLRLQRRHDGADLRRGPFPVALNKQLLLEKLIDPGAYGAALRDMLLADQAAADFKSMRAAAVSNGEVLRVRLHIPPDLHTIRWETLLDPESGRSLALDSYLLLSRYLSADDYAPIQLRPKGNLRALIAVAAPVDWQAQGLPEIKADAEMAPVTAALAGLQSTTINATWEALDQALRASCDILYLVAHGKYQNSQPWLYLVDGEGNTDRRPGSDLSNLLRSLGDRRPRLIVLASCESAGDGYTDALAALGPLLAQAGIPAVLAMQGKLSITTNATFTPTFFRELLIDGAIDHAANSARQAVAARHDWWIPVLYTRMNKGQIWAEPALTEAATTINIAPPRPPMMIGRDNDLIKLKQRVGIGSDVQPAKSVNVLTAMRGWPGVGKTTLAASLAHDEEIAARFPDGVLWASLGQKPDLFGELAKWGLALGVPDLYGAKTVEDASRLLTGLLRTKRALLIVDDVWEAAHLLPFRIGGDGCALLLTTRLPEVARAIASIPDEVYILGVLEPEDALQLLRELAPNVVAANESECRELVKDLEGLPLALQVAGRLLQEDEADGFGVTDLLRDLRDGAQLIAAQAPADRVDIANETTPSVAALLELSTNRLDQNTLVHFAYLGAFAPKPATFDLAAIRSVWEIDDPKPILRVLINRGLLEPTDSRYWMHAILVAHARSFWAEGGE